MELLGSCSLSFSHLGTISPDDDLPDGGLLLGVWLLHATVGASSELLLR